MLENIDVDVIINDFLSQKAWKKKLLMTSWENRHFFIYFFKNNCRLSIVFYFS